MPDLERFAGLELIVEKACARPALGIEDDGAVPIGANELGDLVHRHQPKVLRLLEGGFCPGAVGGFTLSRAVAVGTAERVRIAPDVGVGQHDVVPCRVERCRIESQVRLKPERDTLEGLRGDELRLRRADEGGCSGIGACLVFPVRPAVALERLDAIAEAAGDVPKKSRCGAATIFGYANSRFQRSGRQHRPSAASESRRCAARTAAPRRMGSRRARTGEKERQ